MEDSSNNAFMGTPINIGSQSASLGSALGQALGGGLQQLAANRLQRLQQQQQVGGLAQLLGGNQELAQNILSQSPDVQKQLLGGLFKPEQALTPYQQSQLDLAQQNLAFQQKRAEAKESLEKETTARNIIKDEEKFQSNFYKENIKPVLQSSASIKQENQELQNVVDKAKKFTKQSDIEKYWRVGLNAVAKSGGIIGNLAEALQSGETIAIQKALANLSKGAKERFGGRVTNFELEQFMKRFPNPAALLNPKSAIDILEGIIKVNESLIEEANAANKFFTENKGKKDEKGMSLLTEDSLVNYLNQLQEKKKSDLTNQAAQPETLQPEQPQEQPQLTQEQPQQQLELPQKQPQEQLQAAPTPQEQAQPEQMPESFTDFLKESIEPVGQGLQFQVNTAAQVLKPLITRFGGNVTKIAEYVQEKFGEGNISAISKLAQKLIPDEQQAQEYLKQMGVPEEELENPSKLVTGLQTAGVGIPLAIATYANPFGTLALLGLKGLLSTVAPKLAGFGTALAGGEEKAQEAAFGATQILTDLLPLDFTKRAGKARKINELTKNEIEKITKGSTKQILDNKDTISNIKKTKQNDTNNLKLKADEQIAELQTKIRNVGISRKDYQKKIGSLYENIADLNKENAKLNLEDVDREILYEKLLNVRDDAYFPDKTKINQLIQKYKPRKTEDVETGLLGATGKPITTTKTSGESRTLGDLFEDIKNLFALAKGSKRGSPIYEARETAKALAEKNASPEFITAKKDIDAQYTAASKALDPLEIKRTQNAFKDQIKNIKLNTKKQVDEIANNATQQIDSLDKLNNILTAAQKLDKSSVGKNGVSATDIFTALVNPKYYAGSKAYKAAKGVFTLQPETEERLIFLKEYFPAAFNEIEQAAEEASKSLLQTNKEAADKASKLFLDAVNKGNKLLNKFYK